MARPAARVRRWVMRCRYFASALRPGAPVDLLPRQDGHSMVTGGESRYPSPACEGIHRSVDAGLIPPDGDRPEFLR